MNWRLIGALATLGLVHGAITLFGLTSGFERIAWGVVLLLVGLALGLASPPRLLSHAWITGIGVALATGAVQLLFFDLYLRHNPAAEAVVDQVPGGPYLFTLLMVPVIGSIFGFAAWAIAAGFRRWATR